MLSSIQPSDAAISACLCSAIAPPCQNIHAAASRIAPCCSNSSSIRRSAAILLAGSRVHCASPSTPAAPSPTASTSSAGPTQRPQTPLHPRRSPPPPSSQASAADRRRPPTSIVRHGTTVGTNAMLERKGARVAFVTTAGFEDTIAIGRQTRPSLYDWFRSRPACLVPPDLRFGVPERTTAEGEILRSPTPEDLATLCSHIESAQRRRCHRHLAPLLLRQPAQRAARRSRPRHPRPPHLHLPPHPPRVPRVRARLHHSSSTPTSPPNAAATSSISKPPSPATSRASSLHVMQSSGGIISATLAAAEPVRTVLSGPAGGVIGAWHLARRAGFDRIIGFDMGGTSTDVSLADAAERRPPHSPASPLVAGMPISVPMLDIHTAGAGGGSLARFDAGGILRVGPESAGSVPGPICYGRGDATHRHRRQPPPRPPRPRPLPRRRHRPRPAPHPRLMRSRPNGPLATAEDFAAGILRVAETNMERAIRVISVERGHDPRDFTLVAFGGAGPLHACALARALRIRRVLIPAPPAPSPPSASSSPTPSATTPAPSCSTATHLATLEPHFAALESRGHTEFAAQSLTAESSRSARPPLPRPGLRNQHPLPPPTPPPAFHRPSTAHQPLRLLRAPAAPSKSSTPRPPVVSATPPITLTTHPHPPRRRQRRPPRTPAPPSSTASASPPPSTTAKHSTPATPSPAPPHHRYTSTTVLPPHTPATSTPTATSSS